MHLHLTIGDILTGIVIGTLIVFFCAAKIIEYFQKKSKKENHDS